MRRLAAPLSLLVLASGLVLWLAAVPIVSAGDPCYHDYAMPSQTTALDRRRSVSCRAPSARPSRRSTSARR